MVVKILLADDHPIVRHGLRLLLETEPDFQVVAETNNGIVTVQMVDKYKPDILILDLMMPGLNGLEVTSQSIQLSPATKVIILSMHNSETYVLQSLKNGASGYVLKDTAPNELINAIKEVILGHRYLSPTLADMVVSAYVHMAQEEHDPYHDLSTRERQILQMAAEGFTSSEIAQKLSLSPRTIEGHRANIMEKLELNNQTDLIRYAIKRGIITIEE